MPSDDPQLRASDDDRDRTASLLREHHAAGRLNADEFQERLDATYEAKTVGQLQELLADLPSIDLYHLPEQSMRQQAAAGALAHPDHRPGRLSSVWRQHWGSWASVTLLLFAIWLVTAITSHSASGLWFLWVSVPWGAILLGRWMFGQHPDGDGPASVPGGPAQALPDGSAHDLPGQQLDDQMQRHQQRMQEQMQRHQEQMRRHQERMQEQMQRRQEHLQRRHDRLRNPDES